MSGAQSYSRTPSLRTREIATYYSALPVESRSMRRSRPISPKLSDLVTNLSLPSSSMRFLMTRPLLPGLRAKKEGGRQLKIYTPTSYGRGVPCASFYGRRVMSKLLLHRVYSTLRSSRFNNRWMLWNSVGALFRRKYRRLARH